MNTIKFFAIFAFFAIAFAQLPPLPAGFTDTFIIDDFEVPSAAIVIVTSNANAGTSSSVFVSDALILGGERDLTLTFVSGASNLVLSAGVANGLYSVAAPNGAAGESNLVYDGVDGSDAINISGLSFDMTQFDSIALRTVIASDLATQIIFSIFENGQTCEDTLDVIQGDSPVGYELEYASDFSGSCSFTNVGAIQIRAPINDNVDVELSLVSLFGPVPSASTTPSALPSPSNTRTPLPSASRTPLPSASRTPIPSASRTPAPTQSNTRTPAPSASNTPAPSQSNTRTPAPSTTPSVSPSNTPTPSDTCICKCPIFTCEIFRVDDGDYVYYRGFFDTFRNAPDFFNTLFGI